MKALSSRGFTLIEMLVSTAIIMTLGMLVFAVSSRAVSNAEKAVCISNLRNIGTAIQGYATEHGNRLPGPLWVAQSPLYKPANPSALSYHIIDYLEGRPVATTGPFLLRNFGCPSVMKQVTARSVSDPPVVYRMCGNGNGNYCEKTDGTRRLPWGWYGADVEQVPWRLDEIKPALLGRVYGMIEQDQRMGGLPEWPNQGASGPAHGTQRMALFFDWSVRPLEITDWKP